jgi:hypothetical protein
MSLLPGDIRLSEFEEDLNADWRACKARDLRGFAGTTALSLVVNSISVAERVDFVFYDCGPNIGPLNRVILLDTDFMIVPAACDEFSIRAVRALGYTLVRWISEWRDISDLAPDGTYLLPARLKFIGYVAQQFRVYGGQISSDFRGFLTKIDRHIREDLIAVVEKFDPSLIQAEPKNLQFGEIQNLSSLVGESQRSHKALWNASGNAGLREVAKDSFYQMADRLIQITSSGGKRV